jgi:hypothetical protein
LIALRSTWVEEQGTQTSTRGLGRRKREVCTLRMKCCSIASVMLKSAITPSFSGRTVRMLPGVRPSIFLAAEPTAATCCGPPGPRSMRTETTEGSFSTMPWPRTKISVLAVPRSIERSFEKRPRRLLKTMMCIVRRSAAWRDRLMYQPACGPASRQPAKIQAFTAFRGGTPRAPTRFRGIFDEL